MSTHNWTNMEDVLALLIKAIKAVVLRSNYMFGQTPFHNAFYITRVGYLSSSSKENRR